MNERYLYRIFLSLSSFTDIFVFSHAHSLSRSRHFTTRRYAVLPRGVEGCGSSTTHIPFSDPTRRPPSSDLFDCRSPTRISLISLIWKENHPIIQPSLALFWQNEDHLDTGTSSSSHWILSDLMTTCRFLCRKNNTSLSSIAKCFIYTLPCLSSILLLLSMGEGGGD